MISITGKALTKFSDLKSFVNKQHNTKKTGNWFVLLFFLV